MRTGSVQRGPAPRTRRGPKSGFTLVELMIAVFLMTIGVLAVSQVMAVANRHTAYAREEMIANSLAQEIREKIMSETFGDVKSIFNGVDTDNIGTITAPAADWADHVADRLGPTGRGRITVLDPEEDPDLEYGMLGVEVLLTWKERGNDVELPLKFAIARIGN